MAMRLGTERDQYVLNLGFGIAVIVAQLTMIESILILQSRVCATSQDRLIMFLDTSRLMCLFDRRESRHTHATRHYDRARVRLSHNYVLLEFVTDHNFEQAGFVRLLDQ